MHWRHVTFGSIVWMNLDPRAGHEQAGYRPAIVISDGLIDPECSSFAMVVPVTRQAKGYAFEVEVPSGIELTDPSIEYEELSGVALTDQAKSLDLAHRRAKVVGQVDTKSAFFQSILTNVRSIISDPEEDEEEE